MKILLVEDTRSIAAVLSAQLVSFGHTIVMAENGKVGVERFSDSAPDLVLMDIDMPVLNGIDACKQIRTLEAQTQGTWTPIIFLTALAADENLIRAIEAGGDDYLVKGLSEHVLRAKLLAMARIAGMRRSLLAHAEAERVHERLTLILDTSPDPMLSVDRDGHIVRSNLMAEKFFGYPREALLGQPIEALIPLRFRAGHRQLRAVYLKSPHHRPMGSQFKLQALTSDGREPDVEISLSHSDHGTEQLTTITLRDITERVQQRARLDAALLTAESALLRQREMQDILVHAEKKAALSDLVAGVAHEINTPVGVALSAATYLDDQTRQTAATYAAGDLSEEELTEYFATARQAAQLMTLNSQRAADLIHSFKQMAVDQVGGERRRFDLATFIDEVVLSLRPVLKKSAAAVQVRCPPAITLDSFPGALSQVLTNLVMNTLEHAFAPGQPGQIAISAQLMTDDKVMLRYHDNGKGIPGELHMRVFEPFFTTRRDTGGSGLGLSVVSNIVQQSLQGTVTLYSAAGEGCTFLLRLPRNINLPSRHDA